MTSNILVVEDDPAQRVTFSLFLKQKGFNVIEAENGETAVRLFMDRTPDAVLLDVMLPGQMDGLETCLRMRETPSGQAVPILIVTSLNDNTTINSFFDAGAADFIPKPVNLNLLLRRLKRLIDERGHEMARLESMIALRRSEAKYRALVEAIPDGIARVRTDGTILDFKPNSEFSPPMFTPDVIGKNIAEILPEHYVRLAMGAMTEAVDSGQSQIVEYQFPIHGQMCDYEARTVSAPDSETITLFREITERKSSERMNQQFTETILHQKEELESVNRKLQQTDRVKATFTAMLAHDIRSPLTSLRMALDFFQNRHSFSDEELQESINSSRESLQRVLTLTNDLLEVFRSETDEVFLLRGVVSVEALLGKCLREARLLAIEKKIQLATEIGVEFPLFIGDETKLERVFANLLSNAVKFTPEGGRITIRANLETADFDHWMTVQVADSGEGIAEDELPFIFDPYRQAMSKQRSLGVGLGLAIAQRIIAAHGGTITADSRRGEGSTFTVRIPLKG